MTVPATFRSGTASVIIVNYRGAEDTIRCVSELRGLDWPAELLEIIVVDNASGDGSAERIAEAAPDVTLIRSATNTGFAGGCNLAVQHAHGEYVALINSDARPDAGWLRAAVRTLRSDPSVGAVASKVLDWDGTRLDFVGGNINFAGQGYKTEAGQIDTGAYETPRDVLFFTGSAAVLRASVFRALGGFDEMFFMFFEDVDLGWRMNLRGHRVRYDPDSIVYHKHHAAISKFGSYREEYLLARNALLTIYKNFDDDTLRRALAPALLLTIHNSTLVGDADPDLLDLERVADGDAEERVSVSKSSLAGAYAVEFLTRHLAEIDAKRSQVQQSRVRADSSLSPLYGDLLRRTSPMAAFAPAWDNAIAAFGLDQLLSRLNRVLVITSDTLATRMAGPAIRAYNIARELSTENDVKLVSTSTCTLTDTSFECLQADDRRLRELVAWSDVIVFQGFVLHEAPWIGETEKIIVVDIYDPIHLEQLEQSRAEEPQNRKAIIAATTDVLNRQLKRGDFFLCASEEQRHFWLGQLAGIGRLNPANYDRDSSLHSLLCVVPFGLPDEPPVHQRSAIKGSVDGIGPEDKVILWGGGVYNWFDPLTVIAAVDQLRQSHDNVRLYFLGMKHPNPHVPEMQMAWECRQLSDRLGLTGKFVFFNEEWVDYDDRANYLCDSDVGVSAHFLHVETTFSFRTRILDYLWAGLPIVATEGDAFGRLIEAEGLGVTVSERNVEDMAAALRRALYDEEFIAHCRSNIARVREEYTWQRTLAPLVEFCRAPLWPDDFEDARRYGTNTSQRELGTGRLARNIRYLRIHYREGGLRLVLETGAAKARRLLGASAPRR